MSGLNAAVVQNSPTLAFPHIYTAFRIASNLSVSLGMWNKDKIRLSMILMAMQLERFSKERIMLRH
jgi:hypothetical protein